MKKKLLELIAELELELKKSKELKTVYSEYDYGYINGKEEKLSNLIEKLKELIPVSN